MCSKNKGVIMSVNFGYGGYGMGTNMMGANSFNNNGSNVFQSIASQYNCPTCYQYGPVPYNYQTFVNPLPKQAVNPSFLSRIFRRFTGG